MTKHTILHPAHLASHGNMVDFQGWQMPLHYGSQLDEHHAVRQDAGMFDVSHMLAIDIQGDHAADFLRYVCANDIAKLKQPGKVLYTCMLNPQAGVIDDLIVYFLAPAHYRLVVNAGRREDDLAWLREQAQTYNVTIHPREDLAIIAIQGPHAISKTRQVMNAPQQQAVDTLARPFLAQTVGQWLIARTGYTGEDGLEIMLPATAALDFWQALLNAGVRPCGLGARDSLRLEAGMNLYGNDMDETLTPLESALGWTVAWQPEERDFIGRQALQQQRQAGNYPRLVGLVLQQRGILRAGQPVTLDDGRSGQITSGGFAPTLQQSIAFARLPATDAKHVTVSIRGKNLTATIINPPFVRHGKRVYQETNHA